MRYLLIPLLLLASCTRWPVEGKGGYAQVHNVTHEQILALEDQVKWSEGCQAKKYAAIEFKDAEIQLLYLKRSHYAGDFTFAQREFDNLERLLTIIYHRIPFAKECKVLRQKM
jgi:hypothetical protein